MRILATSTMIAAVWVGAGITLQAETPEQQIQKGQAKLDAMARGEKLNAAKAEYNKVAELHPTGSPERLKGALVLLEKMKAILKEPYPSDQPGDKPRSLPNIPYNPYELVICQSFACGEDEQARAMWKEWGDSSKDEDWLELTRIRSIAASENPKCKVFSFDRMIQADPTNFSWHYGRLIRVYREEMSKLGDAPSKSTQEQRRKKFCSTLGELALTAILKCELSDAPDPRFDTGSVKKISPYRGIFLLGLVELSPDMTKAKAQSAYDRIMKSPSLAIHGQIWVNRLANFKRQLNEWEKRFPFEVRYSQFHMNSGLWLPDQQFRGCL